jgi:RHS repeat-associated protein
VTVNLAYDNAGRILSKQYPAAPAENITYTWDQAANGNKGLGRLTRIDDASGSVQWVYDTLGRVVQETKTTAGNVYTIGYGYDAAGNVIWMTYPSGRIVSYWRDSLGRISGVTTQASPSSPSVTLAYNVAYQPFGPLQSLWYGSSIDLWKTFTQDYLLDVMLVEDTSTSTTYINRAHTRTDNLNLTNIWDNVDSSRNESFWYTAAGRLQNASGIYGALTYYYDGVGNRTYEILTQNSTATTNVYGYPSNNNLLGQISQSGTTVRGFTTDGAGNTITDNRGGPTYTYGYNNRGRLNQVALGSSVLANYTYDGLERLAIRTTQNVSSPGTTNYAYDRSGHLLVEASSAGATTTEYVWLDDMPVAVFANVDSGTPSLWYVHTDHLNRPIKMTDVNKNVVWDAMYWPFGAVYLITGSATNNMRFPGQYFLLETGLHYNWHRHYDPTIGRYLQADPLRFIDGPSLYTYVSSAPTMNVDPSGLQAITTIPGAPPIAIPDYPLPGTPQGQAWTQGAIRSLNGLINACYGAVRHLLEAPTDNPDYDRCIEAANGSDDDWAKFCGSIPGSMPNRVSGGGSARGACYSKTLESRISKKNWCRNQFSE